MKLTNLEKEVLYLIADGKRIKQIMRLLNATEDAVKTRLMRVRRKLGATNNAHAVVLYFKIIR